MSYKRKYSKDFVAKIEDYTSKGFSDSEIGDIINGNKTYVYHITKAYWDRKMEKHLLKAEVELKDRPSTKQIIIPTSKTTGIVASKCGRCSVIRDVKVELCKHCC